MRRSVRSASSQVPRIPRIAVAQPGGGVAVRGPCPWSAAPARRCSNFCPIPPGQELPALLLLFLLLSPLPPSRPVPCPPPPRRSLPRLVLISVTSRRGSKAPKGVGGGGGGSPLPCSRRQLLKAARALNASRVSGIELWSYLNRVFFVWWLLLCVNSQGALRVITLPSYKILFWFCSWEQTMLQSAWKTASVRSLRYSVFPHGHSVLENLMSDYSAKTTIPS